MINKIIEQQIKWAKAQNIVLEKKDGKEKPYVTKLEDNLFLKKLNKETLKNFEEGSGGELKPQKTAPPKMYALRSSAALPVNVFGYLCNNRPLLAKALGIGEIEKFDFELKCETGTDKNPANIDVVIETDSEIIGIESKFTEWFAKNKKNNNKLTDAYFPEQKKGKSLWAEKGYNGIHELAIEMKDHTPFSHLDAAQLMKHTLGLSNYRDTKAQGKKITLIYLYYDCAEDKKIYETHKAVCESHKKEIATFSEKFKAEGIIFKTMTYQDLFAKLKEAASSEHSAYIDYLETRCFEKK